MSEPRRHVITEPDGADLLAGAGIAYPEHGIARNADEAVVLAMQLGWPVVLKVVSPEILHKSDAQGVAVGLLDPLAVVAAYERIVSCARLHAPEATIEGVLVCRQADPGLELIVGGLRDPLFGPTVMFGLGGVFVELLHDMAFRVAPLDHQEADDMIRSIQGYPLLAGARGGPEYDLVVLSDLLCRVSRMLADRPDICELDLNPVRLYKKGLLVLDVRILTD